MKLRLVRFGLLVAVVCAMAALTGSSARAVTCLEYVRQCAYSPFPELTSLQLGTGIQEQLDGFALAWVATDLSTTLECTQLNILATEIAAQNPPDATTALMDITNYETTLAC